MNLPSKQQTIIDHCRTSGTITKKHAVSMLSCYYYCNADKHVGEILSRMVNACKLRRISAGVLELGSGKRTTDVVIKNQISLL
jgi:hypothetical protein